MNETPTPRTDAARARFHSSLEWADFARQLERELAACRAALEDIAKYDIGSSGGSGICPYGCDTPYIARAALEATK
jgi:hypothetical protein